MIVALCSGWAIEKDGIADYSAYLAGGMRSNGIDLRIVPLGHYIDGRAYYADAARKAVDADICHVQFNYLYFNGELPHKNRFLYFSGRVNIPLIMTVHEVRVGLGPIATGFSSRASRLAYNTMLPVLNAWSESLHKRIYAAAGRIIVHTGDHAKAIIGLTKDPEKVTLVPHGIPEIDDKDRGFSKLEAKKILGLDGKRVLMVPGFINRRKGYEKTLELLAGLPEDVSLVIAGGSITESADDIEYYGTIEKLIAEKGLQRRVKITGYLGQRDIPAVMASTDICLAPFSSTAASGALSLCIAYHKPIIASDVSVHREINGRVKCLELFKIDDTKDMLQKTMALLDGRDRLKALSSGAAEYSVKYSYKMTAASTIALYEDILSGHKAGAGRR